MEPTKDSKHAEISITTIPDGGITNVDGEPKGFAPVLVDKVTPGEHTYTIRLTGYVDMQDEINVSEGTRMIATVKLAKQEGALESGTPTSATPSTTASASTILASPTPKLTATPKPSASPKLASPSASPKTATISATPTKVATGPKVRINATGYFQNGQEVLRVRATPTASGAELGFAPKGNEYVYLKETTADGWRKIQFNGQAGWVSGQYTTVTE